MARAPVRHPPKRVISPAAPPLRRLIGIFHRRLPCRLRYLLGAPRRRPSWTRCKDWFCPA